MVLRPASVLLASALMLQAAPADALTCIPIPFGGLPSAEAEVVPPNIAVVYTTRYVDALHATGHRVDLVGEPMEGYVATSYRYEVTEPLLPETTYYADGDLKFWFRTGGEPDLAPPSIPVLDGVYAETSPNGTLFIQGAVIPGDDDTALLEVTFVDDRDDQTIRYVRVGNFAALGSGCAGMPLGLDDSKDYRIEVRALDIAGNASDPAVQDLDVVHNCACCTSGSPSSLAPALGLLLVITRRKRRPAAVMR